VTSDSVQRNMTSPSLCSRMTSDSSADDDEDSDKYYSTEETFSITSEDVNDRSTSFISSSYCLPHISINSSGTDSDPLFVNRTKYSKNLQEHLKLDVKLNPDGTRTTHEKSFVNNSRQYSNSYDHGINNGDRRRSRFGRHSIAEQSQFQRNIPSRVFTDKESFIYQEKQMVSNSNIHGSPLSRSSFLRSTRNGDYVPGLRYVRSNRSDSASRPGWKNVTDSSPSMKTTCESRSAHGGRQDWKLYDDDYETPSMTVKTSPGACFSRMHIYTPHRGNNQSSRADHLHSSE